MDNLLYFLIFLGFLFVIVTCKYRLIGLISNIFLTIGCCSIYSIFLLAGLTLNKSTIFGIFALLFLSISNSFNLFNWIKKYLKDNSYTTKMAIYLANKKHNIYLYESILMLLIPSALLIFLLPTKIKEIGIVLSLGSLFIITIWFLFSNFFLPRLSQWEKYGTSLMLSTKFPEDNREGQTLSLLALISELQTQHHGFNFLKEIKKKKANLIPLDFAPIVIWIGFIGLVFWLSSFELNYPNFFKNNKLLSVDKSSQTAISSALKNLKGNFKELKSIPDSLKNGTDLSSWTYYLFPENLNLSSIISALESGNGQAQKISSTWSIQSTDAFSAMPSLKKTINLIFLSIAPASIYNLFRFGLANTFSLIISSFLFLGATFLLIWSGKLQVPELFPELVLAAFFVLLTFWLKAVLSSKEESQIIPSSSKEQKEIFKFQSRGIKSELKREVWFYFSSFVGVIPFTCLLQSQEVIYAFAFFSCLVFLIRLFFIPVFIFLWSNLNLLIDKYYYHLVNFFVREKNKLNNFESQEENVLGINY